MKKRLAESQHLSEPLTPPATRPASALRRTPSLGFPQSLCCVDAGAPGSLTTLQRIQLIQFLGPAALLYSPSAELPEWALEPVCKKPSKTIRFLSGPFCILVAPRTYLNPQEETGSRLAWTPSCDLLSSVKVRVLELMANKPSDSGECGFDEIFMKPQLYSHNRQETWSLIGY